MIQQGDIYWVQLSPTRGKEQQGLRPCVVISGNGLNTIVRISIICPLTTKIKHYKGSIVLEPNAKNNLKETTEILTHQVRTIDHERFREKIGSISHREVEKIHEGLAMILKY